MSVHKQLMIPGPIEFHEDVLAAVGVRHQDQKTAHAGEREQPPDALRPSFDASKQKPQPHPHTRTIYPYYRPPGL